MARYRENRQSDDQSWGSIFIPSVMAACGLCLVGILQLLPANEDRTVTAIFAPHIAFDEAAARVNNAGAAVLNAGIAGNIITARLKENTNSQMLRNSGAWLILAGSAPELCTARARDLSQKSASTNS